MSISQKEQTLPNITKDKTVKKLQAYTVFNISITL